MSQDITYLPEGKYAVKALLRGSTNETITLTATAINPMTEEENKSLKVITPIGNVGGDLQYGWIQVETPYIIVRPGDILRISMEAKATDGSAWWSADDFGLTWQYVEPLADGIEAAPSNLQQGGKFYDLSGRRTTNPQKGIYIQDGRKMLIP